MKINFALFLLVVFAVATVSGWGWPDIAKIMPVYVAALPGLLMITIQIYREATGWETRKNATGMDMVESGENKLDEATQRKRTLSFFAWFIGGAIGIWLIGIVYALPLLVFLYALLQGKEKWLTSLIIGGCAYLVIWGLFEYIARDALAGGASFWLRKSEVQSAQVLQPLPFDHPQGRGTLERRSVQSPTSVPPPRRGGG